MDSIAELVLLMTQAVVDLPAEVRITSAPGVIATTYHVSVHPTDIGKALGKQGRIADAMRTIAKASAMRERRKIYVDVMSSQEFGQEAVVRVPAAEPETVAPAE